MSIDGLADLNRRFKAIPAALRVPVRVEMEKQADDLVRLMKSLAPNRRIADSIEWTWGAAPKDATVLAQSESADRMRITVFVRIGAGDTKGWDGHWWEFGTAERIQKTTGRKTGRMTAQPFFFPAFRANRRRIKSGITRAMNKALKGSGT